MTRRGARLLHFEPRRRPLLTPAAYRRRVAHHALAGVGLIAGSLAVGVLGYHWAGGYSWLDSLYSASMILGGMGPVSGNLDDTPTPLKWFASFYALFSGVALLTSVGVLIAPVVHRILHRFHLEEDEGSA